MLGGGTWMLGSRTIGASWSPHSQFFRQLLTMPLLLMVPIVAMTAPSPLQMAENIPVPPPTGSWTSAPVVYPSFDPRRQLWRPLGGAGVWHYPIAVGSPVTSEFGWRIHPISGDRRFHSGLDLAAAAGTSVLAVTAAQVQSAGRNGGYGLAIVLQDATGNTQMLYGHLSEILVQPRQWVQPGQVIGEVGSTGNSTGPHLHFEVRRRQGGTWSAIDPQPLLQSAIRR
jgi:murein DD-endopeptidase MepM/ murein hydrolase activator NlpD